MKRWFGSTVLCSIRAGFAGAFLSHWLLSPTPAYGQLVVPPPSRPGARPAATEGDAQRFVLVDARGTVMAEIKMDDGRPEIVLYDKDGRVGWKATPNPSGIRPITIGQ
jgi:hypothetical protein